ncbi:transcriptional regulator DEF1-like isoform X2 [Mizuhopecten yessoensis]|uniref:transcriptional regulator DEF1-like isoform X2 n=1 Tax=Mizuhopecten yessoensis TaxID=6573 RepID=UPI000B45E00F|nr:transcriptional regulator DEF1-like isoform X2 [Mizuhopecten yessoensis]
MDHYLHHSDGDDLDKLINKFELENQNCVRLIQKESQHIEALEKDIREGKSIIIDLQEKTSQLDEDIKQGHRQYTCNRDNCESLKKTLVVLKEHDEALDRQLTALEESSQQDRNGRLEILKHYTDVWENYQGKYKMFPLAKSLEEKQKDVSSLEKRLQDMESQINHLHTQMNEINESTGDELKDLNKFIVSVAAVKLSTESMSCQIKQMMEARGQIKDQIRHEKEGRQEREAQMLAAVNAREEIIRSEASLIKSSPQDHIQPRMNQDHVEPKANQGHIQPHGSPEPVQAHGRPEQAQPHLSPELVQPCASPEYVQPCLSTEQAQPHPNPENVQPCMDIQESDGDGSSVLINMFSEKQDDVDTERDMETNVKSSLQSTICHPLMALPQNLSSLQSCPQTLPHQSQQRQAYQGQRQPQQGQYQPQPVQQLQQQQQQQQVQRQQLQVHQQQRQSQQVQHQQVQEQLQQEQQQHVQRQPLQVHQQQRQSQQVQQHQQVQEQLQQVQRQPLQVHQQQRQSQQVQQHQQVQEQLQQEQQQQVQGQSYPMAQPTASGLNHVSAPNFDQMSVPRAASINQMPALKTSNYNQIFEPRVTSISQMPAPKTPNLSRISMPAAPIINQMSAPRTPNFNQVSAPRAPSINQMSAPRTPNFNQVSAPRAPSINQMSAPRTPNFNQVSAPRAPIINQMSAPRTPNFNQVSAPRAPSINQMSASRSLNQKPSSRVSSISQMSAPRTPILDKISAQRAPSISQMSAPKTQNFGQMLISQRLPTQNQITLPQKELNNVSTSSSSLSGQAAVCSTQPTKATRQTDTVQHCPKTPPSSGMGHDAMDRSPFDFEKHQQNLKLLSKSPGPISYSTRTMFSENQDDPQGSVGSFLNPFIGEASNLFGERNTGGFETGQAMSLFGERNTGGFETGQAMSLFGNDKPNNLFGNEGTTSTGPGNQSGSGGESLMSLFGGGDQTSSNLGSQEQETSFSFNFGTDKGGDSLMSLFGGGSDNANQGNNTKETSFSMNFGGGSNTTDSPRGFSLF